MKHSTKPILPLLLLPIYSVTAIVFCSISADAETTQPHPRPKLEVIEKAAAAFHDPDEKLVHMYRAGITNAVDRQSFLEPDGTIYVQTGDIPAQWLRDSSAQVRPYLYFAKDNKEVQDYLRKVIARQVEYVLIDPYANAFKENKQIWEQKYELDSLCYPIILAWTYWRVTDDSSIFTPQFEKSMVAAINTMRAEQNHAQNSKYTHDELTHDVPTPGGPLGPVRKDSPVALTGMVWSGFRPSDDACRYHFLIPSEMMAVVALRGLEEIERSVYKNDKLGAAIAELKKQIDDGIHNHGIVTDKQFGKVFAYEVDGLGNHLLLDDANIPSLLSAPYLGYVSADDPVYQNTRRLLFSKANKNFASGKIASGIGSEHTPKGYIWPLAIVIQGLTESDPSKRKQVLSELLACDPGDHLLHESFEPNEPTKYTRPDFGWPNALFAEFIMLKLQNKPALPNP